MQYEPVRMDKICKYIYVVYDTSSSHIHLHLQFFISNFVGENSTKFEPDPNVELSFHANAVETRTTDNTKKI